MKPGVTIVEKKKVLMTFLSAHEEAAGGMQCRAELGSLRNLSDVYIPSERERD